MFEGMKSLLASSKGTLSLIIVSVASAALMAGKLDGMYFAGVMTIVSGIYHYARTQTDIASMTEKAP